METTIHGSQLSYVYTFMGRVDEKLNVVMIDDIDYLDAEKTHQVDGVYFPDWGKQKNLDISFDFEPIVYAINDGQNSVQAFLMPEEYGKDSAVYSLEGDYQFASGDDSRYAKLLFMDGELFKVIGFTGKDGSGASHEITPENGDRFTIVDQGINLDENAASETYYQAGGTLTFGDAPITWEEIDAPQGTYVVGFIAEDFDGNQYEEFETVEVQ
jgi:hypothetical protein